MAHLVRCIAGHRGFDSDDEDEMDGMHDHDSDFHPGKNWARTRTFSISSPDENASALSNLATVPKEVTLDYAEISAVPPLPLWLLLAADQGTTNIGDSAASAADSLFHPSEGVN